MKFGAGGKKDINRLFYGNPHLFAQDGSVPPRWKVQSKILPDGMYAKKPGDGNRRIQKLDLYEWQQEALRNWRQKNYHGVVEAVTGAGKSWVGLAAADDQLRQGGSVLVLVPSLELLGQWANLLKDFSFYHSVGVCGNGRTASFKNHQIIASTVQSARNNPSLIPSNGNSLLIADECHRYGSAANSKALRSAFTRRLGLTATFERNDDGLETYLKPYFGETCFSLGYPRALKEDVISKFRAAFIAVDFSPSERQEYDALASRLGNLKFQLTKRHEVTATPFGEFIKEVAEIACERLSRIDYHRNGGILAARQFLSAFTRKRRLLAETSSKLDGLHRLVQSIKHSNRTLVFTQTIRSADSISDELNRLRLSASSVHSGTSKRTREKLLQDFVDGRVKVLVAPHILDEGINMPDVDLGIIVAGSKTRREMIQRMGRVLRKKSDGRIAKFALLFVSGSSEDPAFGAHEAFISDVEDNAIETRKFSSCASSDEMAAWLFKARHA